jgi:hypothetical protein
MLADTGLSSPNSGSYGECKYLTMTKRDSPRGDRDGASPIPSSTPASLQKDGPVLGSRRTGQRRGQSLSGQSEEEDMHAPPPFTIARSDRATVLLTGLGKRELTTATAETLAQGDAAALILLGPSQSETQASIDEINSKYPKVKVIFVTMDLGSLDSVRAAAKTINSLDVPIDGIVGYPTVIAAKHATTRDGIESHLQFNYLSHYLLVNLLLGKMPEGSRVVMVSSSIRPDSPAPSFDNPGFSVVNIGIHLWPETDEPGWQNIPPTGRLRAVHVRQRPVHEGPGGIVSRPVHGCVFGQSGQ